MYRCQYRCCVRFEWDELKNQINIRKHGIDFRDAVDVFDHPVLTAIDQREDYGEERWIALVPLHRGYDGLSEVGTG